jgi:hypothetical protein
MVSLCKKKSEKASMEKGGKTMRRILLLSLLTVALVGAAPGQGTGKTQSDAEAPAQGTAKSQSDAEIEKEILKIESERDQAREKGDNATLNRILADDYFYIGVRGNVRTKANRLDDYEAGVIKVFSVKKDNFMFKIYGDTVLMTGRETSITQYRGKPNDKPRQFTNVYIKLDGRWRLVFHQATTIGEPW